MCVFDATKMFQGALQKNCKGASQEIPMKITGSSLEAFKKLSRTLSPEAAHFKFSILDDFEQTNREEQNKNEFGVQLTLL